VYALNGRQHAPTIAVDVMGGDHAPGEAVRGAIDASRRGAKVILVGATDAIAPFTAGLDVRLPVEPSGAAIGMDEPVTQALRRKDSSLHVAMRLVADGRCDAAVSAGNSAAIMAISLHVLGRQPGIDRPAFGSSFPTKDGSVFVLDIGANSTVRASNLVQFAIMGAVYLQVSRGIVSPRIALLSNGTEDSKGTREVKEANEALRKLDLNFIGNIEGNQVFDGVTDVVVTDGFTGNVLLKGGEAVAAEIFDMLKVELSRDLPSRVAAAVLMPAFQRIKRRLDFEEYGGAPVLGVNGVMINCHGRSSAKAFTNAILLAGRSVSERLVERTGEALHQEHVESGRTRLRLRRALHLRPGEA
jgi:phosphate acyltransferase